MKLLKIATGALLQLGQRLQHPAHFLAPLLILGLSPSWAQTLGTAPSIAGGTIELIWWSPQSPEIKSRQICSVTGTSVACTGRFEYGAITVSGAFAGTLRGSTISGNATDKGSFRSPECSYSYDSAARLTIELAADGTQVTQATNSVANNFSVSGTCGPYVPKTTTDPGPTTTVGTWRLLAAGAGTASVRIEGNTIFVTDGSGTERVLTLVPPTKASPPAFNPPTVGGEAKAFEKYLMTHMFEASYAHLPPDQRQNFISGMPMPSDVAGEAAQAVLDAGESAANWVRDNPADASLLVLSTAVSLAFPLSAFANPAVATGGAAVLRGVVGTAMVAGTSGFVQKLMSNVFTDQTALQRFKEAAAKGAGDAVATVPSSLTGAGVEKAAEQIIGKAAVMAGSVAVGIGTDKVTEKLQVSEKTAALVMKAPSYASSLLTLPDPSPEPGGMSLNFDR